MPQMMPLMWMFMWAFSISTLLGVISFTYFNYLPSLISNNKKKSPKSEWTWTW